MGNTPSSSPHRLKKSPKSSVWVIVHQEDERSFKSPRIPSRASNEQLSPRKVRRLSPPGGQKGHNKASRSTSQVPYIAPTGTGRIQEDYGKFLREFPEYRLTWTIDALRGSDYKCLDGKGETYADYMGGSIYPESLARIHADYVANNNALGHNTHPVGNSSTLSLQRGNEARASVLSFFDAPADYICIFTQNASAALKLVGESFPFTTDGCYVLGVDSHASVNGIRQYASENGAEVVYIPSTPYGGMMTDEAQRILFDHRPPSRLVPSLFALTASSNVTNTKNPLSLLEYATALGYYTVLDAAALAPTSKFSLRQTPADAMAVSFHKMFGYPTRIGALIVKKRVLEAFRRPRADGTLGHAMSPMSTQVLEHFEEDMINYLALPAVTDGLRFLATYIPVLPLRLSCLLHYLHPALAAVRHDTNGAPVVRILSRRPIRKLKAVGDQSDVGSTIALVFLDQAGRQLPNAFIEYAASRHNISLRSGYMSNPGGVMSMLGIEPTIDLLEPGMTTKELEGRLGLEVGVVRISFGLASNFQDAWNIVELVKLIGIERRRLELWGDWTHFQLSKVLA